MVLQMRRKKKAKQEKAQLRQKEQKGELVNFRDIIQNQELGNVPSRSPLYGQQSQKGYDYQDYHLRWPQKHPPGWEYLLDASENWIKNKQEWPVNVQKRKREQEQRYKEKESAKSQEPKQEHEWKMESDVEHNKKHSEAYAPNGDQNGTSNEEEPSTNEHKEEKETEYQRLL